MHWPVFNLTHKIISHNVHRSGHSNAIPVCVCMCDNAAFILCFIVYVTVLCSSSDGSMGRLLVNRQRGCCIHRRRDSFWCERAPTSLAIIRSVLAATERWSTTASFTKTANSPSTRRSSLRTSCSLWRWAEQLLLDFKTHLTLCFLILHWSYKAGTIKIWLTRKTQKYIMLCFIILVAPMRSKPNRLQWVDCMYIG